MFNLLSRDPLRLLTLDFKMADSDGAKSIVIKMSLKNFHKCNCN